MNQALLADLPQVMQEALDTGLFVSLCTLQAPSGHVNPDGSPDNGFVDVPGLINIPCMAPPLTDSNIQATEVKSLAEILSEAMLHILLNAWYPQIENGASQGWQAIIDGTVFDLMGAESDSQGQMTRLKVRLAKV